MISIKQIHKYDCDVLIIGGGPSGSGLAYHLAKNKIKVKVVEAQRFPRDKICGDGVSPIALAELDAMGISKWQHFSKANEISKVGLFIKNDSVFIDLSKPDNLPYHARIIPRIELDNWIYNTAKKAGAAYLEDTRLISYTITDDAAFATLKQGDQTIKIKAKIIVGADGSNSTVARLMHGAKNSDEFQLLGLRAYYENINGPTDRVDIYFTGESFPGIYWLFPKGESGANIGMAMVSSTLPYKPSHVRNMLASHIQNDHHIKERIGNGEIDGNIDGWMLKFFNSKSRIHGNRILLVGDAAGLINPLSGDGIQYALLSARWASETLIACVKKNDYTSKATVPFRKRVDKELGYDFALSNLVVQFARNKTLSAVWMQILEVMISRCKEDKAYANTVAGIFEGTYPSYKALNSQFIINSILQAAKDIGGKAIADMISDPSTIIQNGLALSQTTLQVLEEIGKDPSIHGKWLLNTANKTIAVAGHILKSAGSKLKA